MMYFVQFQTSLSQQCQGTGLPPLCRCVWTNYLSPPTTHTPYHTHSHICGSLCERVDLDPTDGNLLENLSENTLIKMSPTITARPHALTFAPSRRPLSCAGSPALPPPPLCHIFMYSPCVCTYLPPACGFSTNV